MMRHFRFGNSTGVKNSQRLAEFKRIKMATNHEKPPLVFSTLEDFKRNLRKVEEETDSRYITFKKEQHFGNKNVQPSPEKTTNWGLKHVDFDGVPFQLVGTRVYECHLGKDRNVRKKEKYHADKQQRALEDHVLKAGHSKVQDTKKMDCPVQFKVYHVIKFPGFKINEETKKGKKKASAELKAALAKDPSTVEAIVEYRTCFPSMYDHKYHPIGGQVAELHEAVDHRVRKCIEKLTLAGATKVSEIKHHLHTFVADELFRGEPEQSGTLPGYSPTDMDIWSIMARTKDATSNSALDQINLQVLSTRWSSQDGCYIKCCPSQFLDGGSQTKLMWCYQTAWQRRLLHAYGQQMCLLDASYRSCQYSLPLFFLSVRTNVCFTVVGVIVSHTEDIRQALQVFKGWNPEWHPSHFLADFCEEEIGALEAEFKDAKILLCDFLREKAWLKWVRKRDHGVSHVQDTVLKLLRDIAAAATTEEYHTCLSKLQESEVWKENKGLQTWLTNKWLKDTCIQRWVQAFKDENIKVAMYANNGAERQDKTLSSSLAGRKGKSLSDMLTVLVTDFLPTQYQRYFQLNVAFSSCCRRNHQNLPTYLQDRPGELVTHVMSRLAESQNYQEEDIIPMSPGVFYVKSSTYHSTQHTVNFGATSASIPSCTCSDWSKHKLPCKHFCAVFNLKKEWGWEKLSAAYRDNPLFALDSTALSSYRSSETDNINSPSIIEQHNPVPSTADPPSPSSSLPEHEDLPDAREHRLTKLKSECASLLKEMTYKTHNLQDELYLTSVKEQLSRMLDDMFTHGAKPPGQTPSIRKRKISNNHRLTTFSAKKMKSTLLFNVSVNNMDKDQNTEGESKSKNESAENEWLVVNQTKLTQKDRQILQDQCINDKHINSAQSLIQGEYPLIDGLWSTDILTANQHNPVSASSDCIQMHKVQDHWVVSTSIRGSITVYDSLCPSMAPELRTQLVNLYKHFAHGVDSILPVEVICAQRQRGLSDCGLFAVANAVALAEDIPPVQVDFDQSQMRSHLENCFEMKAIKMFPHNHRVGQESIVSSSYKLSTKCSCHKHRPGSPMIMCDKCLQWFHFPCVNLTESEGHDMITQKQDYACPSCRKA